MYRLCRIVYPNYRFTQLLQLYVIIIIIIPILGCILLCPFLIERNIVYVSDDFTCFVPLTNVRSVLYAASVSYGIPMILLWLMYFRILIFLRQQPTVLPQVIKRRQKRHLIAIKRIFVNISTLLTLGIPGIVIVIITLINGSIPRFGSRIFFLGVEVGMAILSIEMIFMSPKLRAIVLKRFQRNRVAHFESGIQMRPTVTAR